MPTFGSYDFDRMNETDVRETVMVNILRELGYRHSSKNDIITEQSLRYPKQFLGRKKPTDPDLRGKADYILEVDQRLRWVAEVKAPSEKIGDNERAQAYSYASHPEVKAIYFLVTNGRLVEVHRTVDSPSIGAVLTLKYEELSEKWHALANILSPDALKRNYSEFILDTGKPLGTGLRSFAKVINGTVVYTSCVPELPGPQLVGMEHFVQEGTIERMDGKNFAYLNIRSGRREIDEYNRSLGLDVFDMSTEDQEISTDPNKPTAFFRALNWKVPRGTLIPNPMGGPSIPVPLDLLIETNTTARGILNGTEFSGSFDFDLKLSPMLPLKIVVKGQCKIQLS